MEFFSIKDIASRRLSQDLLPKRESPHARRKPTLHISIECEEDANQPDSNWKAKTPRVLPTRSKSGSLQIGDFKIQYKGLKNSDKNQSHLHGLLSFQPNISQVTNHKDFVQIRTLGKGTSGSVVEAIHIPTMTIVAIKILPITNIDGLQYICNELSVLRENYMELCMVSLENPNVSSHSFDNINNTTINNNSDIYMLLNNSNDATEKQNNHNTFDTSMIKCKKQNLRRRSISSLIDHQSKCPQVLGLYDAFLDSESEKVDVVVEYMDGGSVQDVIDSGGCSNEIVLADYAYQCLLGLHFLHSNKHMHRDIKPGNILLNCDGVVKLADFGISKIVATPEGEEKDGKESSQNSCVGTRNYMSPERIANKPYSYPCDVWSLGLTIFAMAIGKYPLADHVDINSYWELSSYILEQPIPLPGKSFSPEFNNFIGVCLEKNPAERPTAEELLQHEFLKEMKKHHEAHDMKLIRSLSSSEADHASVSSMASHTPNSVSKNFTGLRSFSTNSMVSLSKSNSSISDNELIGVSQLAINFVASEMTPISSQPPSCIVSRRGSNSSIISSVDEDALITLQQKINDINWDKHDSEDDEGGGDVQASADPVDTAAGGVNVEDKDHDSSCDAESTVDFDKFHEYEQKNNNYLTTQNGSIEDVRRHHMTTILYKIKSFFESIALNLPNQNTIPETMPSASEIYVNRSLSTTSILSSIDETTISSNSKSQYTKNIVTLPHFYDEEGNINPLWTHFAFQLHLPVDEVIATAVDILKTNI